MTGHTPWSEVRTPQPGDDLRKAIIDLCWKAAPNGEDEDGYVTHYVVASGYMHRLIGAAQGAGIPASFRVRCGHGWDQDAAEGYQCPVCLNPTLQRNDGQEAPDGH